VRIDSGYEAGDSVSQYYDNLMAKWWFWAEDRERRHRMLRARGEHIDGWPPPSPRCPHPLAPRFVAATHSTRWVEDTLDSRAAGGADGEDTRETAECCAT